MKDNCPFCLNNRKEFLAQNNYNVEQMYFYEDEVFSISPDLAPLVTGHLLIIPKEHYASFGEMTDKRTLEKISDVSEKLLGSSDLLYFEHGAVIEGEGGASVDHAHLHVMPRPHNIDVNSIDYYIKSSGYVLSQKVNGNHDYLHSLFLAKQPYIYYKLQGNEYAYPVDVIPHQFLRLMLQPYCSVSYNWRETYKLDECRKNVLSTILYVEKVKSI